MSDLLKSLQNDDSKNMENLMNLVMQFRKVCNHPELFERMEVVSPLAFSMKIPSPVYKEDGIHAVILGNWNAIFYEVPERIVDLGMFSL